MEICSYDNELYHHGVKGMKWGVRRYQNKDGTRTPAGKKREEAVNKEKPKRTVDKKKIAGMAIMTTTVTTAAVLYGTNPAVRKAVNKTLSSAGKMTVKALKTGSKKTVALGKKYATEAMKSAKDGVKEGIKEAPKKATKAIVTGIAMNTAKRMLDNAVGKKEAERIFKANNNKKIDSFWKVYGGDDGDD